MANKIKSNYEDSIKQLETVLEKLENNDIELEDSIKEFEQGVLLVKHCQKILENTEQKIKGLISTDDK